MHKRVVPALSDGGVSCLGDAGHLSSPMGGEGINSALMDGANIAWKLALVLRGAAKPSLLDTYAIERGLADRHVLEVSNEIHSHHHAACRNVREGGEPRLCRRRTPAEALAGLRKRSMLDVSYKGSLLIDEGAGDAEPAPGARFPGWCDLDGATHHLVFSGPAPELDDFRARWGGLVSVVGLDRRGRPRETGGAGGGRRRSGPPGRFHRLPARRGG